MEAFQILIVLGAVAFMAFRQVKKDLTVAPPQEEDPLEEIPAEEIAPDTMQPLTQSALRPRKPKKHKATKQTQSPTPSAPSTGVPAASNAPTASSRLRIHSKAEARRAFLYAEIMHRKYE